MAKVTMEQVKKWSAKLSNGFVFDIERYVVWSEKQAIKYIPLEDGSKLGVTLSYRRVRHPNGFSYTGKYQPCVHFQRWYNSTTEGMMHSFGLGASVDIGTEQDKQMWNELCKLSTILDDAKLMELAKLNKVQLSDKVGRIL